jgi:hypothetical protein
VIAINKAIEIPVTKEMWMVADWWAIKTSWFEPGYTENSDVFRIFSYGLSQKSGIEADLSFNFVPRLGQSTYFPDPLRFRPDGTVAGIAIEAVSRFGAKKITLCGIDMSGNSYFDGNKSSSKTCPHGNVWAYVPYLNSLIQWYQKEGVQIESLSPTKLNLYPKTAK